LNYIIEKINEYCQWTHIEDMAVFIETAASLIFEKDKNWKAHQRSVKRAIKKGNL